MWIAAKAARHACAPPVETCLPRSARPFGMDQKIWGSFSFRFACWTVGLLALALPLPVAQCSPAGEQIRINDHVAYRLDDSGTTGALTLQNNSIMALAFSVLSRSETAHIRDWSAFLAVRADLDPFLNPNTNELTRPQQARLRLRRVREQFFLATQ